MPSARRRNVAGPQSGQELSSSEDPSRSSEQQEVESQLSREDTSDRVDDQSSTHRTEDLSSQIAELRASQQAQEKLDQEREEKRQADFNSFKQEIRSLILGTQAPALADPAQDEDLPNETSNQEPTAPSWGHKRVVPEPIAGSGPPGLRESEAKNPAFIPPSREQKRERALENAHKEIRRLRAQIEHFENNENRESHFEIDEGGDPEGHRGPHVYPHEDYQQREPFATIGHTPAPAPPRFGPSSGGVEYSPAPAAQALQTTVSHRKAAEAYLRAMELGNEDPRDPDNYDPTRTVPAKMTMERILPFDGEETRKFVIFLSDLDTFFQLNPKQFGLGSIKGHINRILTAKSHLTDTARDWYEGGTHDPKPDYMFDWNAFRNAMTATFSNPLDKREAAYKLETLKQADKYKDIQKYNIRFMNLAQRSGLTGEGARQLYERGLDDRIKDALAGHDKEYDTLEELRLAAQRQYIKLRRRDAEIRARRGNSSTVPESRRITSGAQSRSSPSRIPVRNVSVTVPSSGQNARFQQTTYNKPGSKNTSSAVKLRKDGTRVECHKCGGNHYAPDCTAKESKLNVMVNQSNPQITDITEEEEAAQLQETLTYPDPGHDDEYGFSDSQPSNNGNESSDSEN